MPPTIKAKLELIPGGSPAVPGTGDSSGDVGEALKDISRSLKKPSNLLGGGEGGGGLGLFGAGGAAGGVASLLKSPIVLGVLGTVASSIFAVGQVKKTFDLIQEIKDNFNDPKITELIESTRVLVDQVIEDRKPLEEFNQKQEESFEKLNPILEEFKKSLENIKQDGISLGEVPEFLNIEKGVNNIRREAAVEGYLTVLHEALPVVEELLNLSKENKDVIEEYGIAQELFNQLSSMSAEEQDLIKGYLEDQGFIIEDNTLKVKNQIDSQKSLTTELEKQRKILVDINKLRKVGTGRRSGDDIFETEINDVTFRGKINQGNLQGKFIGVRVK